MKYDQLKRLKSVSEAACVALAEGYDSFLYVKDNGMIEIENMRFGSGVATPVLPTVWLLDVDVESIKF